MVGFQGRSEEQFRVGEYSLGGNVLFGYYMLVLFILANDNFGEEDLRAGKRVLC